MGQAKYDNCIMVRGWGTKNMMDYRSRLFMHRGIDFSRVLDDNNYRVSQIKVGLRIFDYYEFSCLLEIFKGSK